MHSHAAHCCSAQHPGLFLTCAIPAPPRRLRERLDMLQQELEDLRQGRNPDLEHGDSGVAMSHGSPSSEDRSVAHRAAAAAAADEAADEAAAAGDSAGAAAAGVSACAAAADHPS